MKKLIHLAFLEETLKKAVEVSGENSAFVKLLKQQIKEEKEKLDQESSATDEHEL